MSHSLDTLNSSPQCESSESSRDQSGGFHVVDEPSANWVVRKIVESRAYAERVKAWAVKETKRAEREEQQLLWRFGPELEAWLDGHLADGSEIGTPRKSVRLPAGCIGRRSVSAKMEIVCSDTALAWARTHCPEAIRTEETLAKSKLNEHFVITGELPEGVALREASETFYVK